MILKENGMNDHSDINSKNVQPVIGGIKVLPTVTPIPPV
jgi:hypothetical protein